MDWTGQRARNRGGIRHRGEKTGRVASQKHIFIFVCSKHFFEIIPLLNLHSLSVPHPTTEPLCWNLSFSFLWSATVHMLQRAQDVWPAGVFFRPQRCRCSGWPGPLWLLPRQQLPHQAAAAGLQHPGYPQAEEQQRSDTVVLQRTLTQPFITEEPFLNQRLVSLHFHTHKCMLISSRKFQRNAFTQYALEQLNDEEKELMLQSESLKAFMSSVAPR